MYLYRMVLSYVNIQLDFVRYMLMRGVAAGHSFLLLHSILLCDVSSFFPVDSWALSRLVWWFSSINNAAMNISEHVSSHVCARISLGYVLRN